MRLVNRSAVFMVAAVLGAGCVQEIAPTVEYFRAHKQERTAQLARCTNEAARGKSDPACVNAREAERLDSIGRLRDLPPVGLPTVPPNQEDEEQGGKPQD